MLLPSTLDDVRLGHRTYEPGGTEHNENATGDYLLVLPLSPGRLRVRSRDEVVHRGPVRSGMVRVVAPGERSAMATDAGFDAVMLRLPGRAFRAAAQGAGADALLRGRSVLRPRADVRHLGLALDSARAGDGTHRDLLVQGLATALLAVVLDHPEGPRAPRRAGDPLTDAQWEVTVAFADTALRTGLDLGSWAAALGMPVPEFAHRFRERTGVSPYAWFVDRRVAAACRLLRGSDAGLAEIAVASGFASQSHFTDVFRRRVGVPPGRWRRELDHRGHR
jgi:AraC family transcriptional regulator